METPYDDILHLPHPTSMRHPRMPWRSRAAQFAPFAALTGHQAAVDETARLTETRPELDETVKAAVNERLQFAQAHRDERPVLTFVYFVPDPVKSGGAYVTVSGVLKRLDDCARLIILRDGTHIPADDILEVRGELFRSWED